MRCIYISASAYHISIACCFPAMHQPILLWVRVHFGIAHQSYYCVIEHACTTVVFTLHNESMWFSFCKGSRPNVDCLQLDFLGLHIFHLTYFHYVIYWFARVRYLSKNLILSILFSAFRETWTTLISVYCYYVLFCNRMHNAINDIILKHNAFSLFVIKYCFCIYYDKQCI